ncbi:MAG: AI-2E family transporter [Acholeplasmatales bacterium]|jgi:predicted PurR-regulated permease PerM|nr:AI-2E family transporter [Acholeplasmatales bacterium]
MAKKLDEKTGKKLLLYLSIITLILIIIYLVTLLFPRALNTLFVSFMLIINPALIALFLSYLLEPIVLFLNKKIHIKRGIAVGFIIIFISFVCLTGLYFLFKVVIEQSIIFVKNTDFDYILSEINKFFLSINIDFNSMFSFENIELRPILVEGLAAFKIFFSSISSFVISFVLVVVFLLFYLIDRDFVFNSWTQIFPEKIKVHVREIGRESNLVIRAYFRSKFLSMLILFILFFLVFFGVLGPSSLGISLVFAFLIALLDLIPYVGPLVGILVPMIYGALFPAYGLDWFVTPLIMLGANFIIQFIQNNVIIPKLAGKEMKINTLLILVSMVFFGNLLGVWGILASIPLCGIIMVIAKYIKNWYDDEDSLILSIQNRIKKNKEDLEIDQLETEPKEKKVRKSKKEKVSTQEETSNE